MHYGDALTPQNIPLGHFFSPRVKRFGCRNFHLAGASGLPRSTERIRVRRELLRRKVRSRRGLDWDLFY